MKTLSLNNKRIFVTGIDGFLGKHIRSALIEEGAIVIGTDIKQTDTAHELNIVNVENVEDYIEYQATLGIKFDGLINNAAVSFKGLNITDEQFDKTMAVNIKGTYNCMTKFKPLLTENASIVNISSIYGHYIPDFGIYDGSEEWYNNVSYGISKAGIEYMTKYMAKLYAPIRFNCISPGGIFNNHKDDFIQKYSQRVALKRMASVDEICNVILFLLSPMSSYITGANINVDGGFGL